MGHGSWISIWVGPVWSSIVVVVGLVSINIFISISGREGQQNIGCFVIGIINPLSKGWVRGGVEERRGGGGEINLSMIHDPEVLFDTSGVFYCS